MPRPGSASSRHRSSADPTQRLPAKLFVVAAGAPDAMAAAAPVFEAVGQTDVQGG